MKQIYNENEYPNFDLGNSVTFNIKMKVNGLAK